jgi:hypothetical protein
VCGARVGSRYARITLDGTFVAYAVNLGRTENVPNTIGKIRRSVRSGSIPTHKEGRGSGCV